MCHVLRNALFLFISYEFKKFIFNISLNLNDLKLNLNYTMSLKVRIYDILRDLLTL